MRGRDYGYRPGYSGDAPNFGSARTDYGDRAYGGGLNEQGVDRGWWDKTSDEVSSWFGDDEAERRRRMDERREARGERGSRRGSSYPVGMAYSSPETFGRNWYNTRARDVMTRNVATVHPDDSVRHAAQIMADCDCGAIPVVDWQGRLIGMITDRDITVRLVAENMRVGDARVGDCMTNEAFACHENDSLETCMRTMSRHQIRRMPIVDDQNRIAGIVSQGDLAQHASDHTGTGERRAVADVVCAVSEPSRSSYR
jgi:CBS domain-containing protein